jgi:perosamine synthetase
VKVRLFKPSVGREELDAVADVFERAWLGLGSKVEEFETLWSRYLDCKYSIAVNSGTAALHLALAALRLPKHGKVLVPGITFISTAAAALYNHLEPVFVDVRKDTLGIDLDDLEAKITDECVAVIAVHMGGHPVPMDELCVLAKRYGLRVIEDCAHCAGGEYQGKKLGTWGDIGCFSFEEKKSLTTGDGGMICTNIKEVVDSIKAMRWVGIDKDTWKRSSLYTSEATDARHWYYTINCLGYKYNMNDLSAAIGLVQLKKLDDMNRARSRAIQKYLDGLAGLKKIKPLLPYRLEGSRSYWIFGVRAIERDKLIRFLKSRGIATSVHYTPLTLHPLFSQHSEKINNALKLYDQMVTLPLFAEISSDEIDYVVNALIEFEGN